MLLGAGLSESFISGEQVPFFISRQYFRNDSPDKAYVIPFTKKKKKKLNSPGAGWTEWIVFDLCQRCANSWRLLHTAVRRHTRIGLIAWALHYRIDAGRSRTLRHQRTWRMQWRTSRL